MSKVVSRCTFPLRRLSRPGVYAARCWRARSPYGVAGAPTPRVRGVRWEIERWPDGVAVVTRRLGVRGYLVWLGRRCS